VRLTLGSRKVLKLRVLKVLLFCCFFALSVTSIADSQERSNKQALLAEVFPNACVFSGTFVQEKWLDGLENPLRTQGDFFFSCKYGLVWNTVQPIKEVFLYADSTKSFRVDERGRMLRPSGGALYAMSRIVFRILEGDVEYFSKDFELSRDASGALLLVPRSKYMRRALKQIHIQRIFNDQAGDSIRLRIIDKVEQSTQVVIDNINDYPIDSWQKSYEKCKALYPTSKEWCVALR
jgi:hypothetical protein